MIDTYLRSSYQKILIHSFIKKIENSSIKPMHLTLCALIFGIFASISILFQYSFFAVCLLLLSGFFDTLDGSLARLKKQTSAKGAVWDIVSDRIVEFCVVFALFLLAPQTRAIISMTILGSILICITTFLIVGVFTENQSEKSFYYSPGIIERTEAFIFFTLMIIFPDSFQLIGIVFSTLVFLTAAVRVWQFSEQSRN